MGIVHRSLRGLFPGGSPWTLSGNLGAVVEALGIFFERVRDYHRGVLTESNPGTATDTLERWYRALGLPYDATLTLAQWQAVARQQRTALGGQNLDYLNSVLQEAYPDVEIEQVTEFVDPSSMAGAGQAGLMQATSYPSWLSPTPTDGSFPVAYYRVVGTVATTSDVTTITGLLDRIAPAEMEPVFAVTILDLTETAEAGLAMAGLAEAGRDRT